MIIACLHGSSLISTRNGLKRIDQLIAGDEVLSGPKLDELVKVDGVAQCWISTPGPEHDAVIFEPGSLRDEFPSERLIIDPGHPICTQEEFLNNGIESLRPAGSYINGDNKIYARKWTDPLIQEEPSMRYDLVLPAPYCTYIANGLVVKSLGHYHHTYKDLM